MSGQTTPDGIHVANEAWSLEEPVEPPAFDFEPYDSDEEASAPTAALAED